jgi:hypothetical protein
VAVAIKGEVGFKAADQNWTLVYDFNALCSIEEELEVDVANVATRLGSPSVIRSVFRIGLAAYHGAMSDIEAGRLIHDLGAQAAAEIIGKAFQAAFPEAAGDDQGAEGKAPRTKTKPGTGRAR